MNDIKSQFIQAVRPHDVELSEDLNRRVPDVKSVKELNSYFHGLLAQQSECSIELRSQLSRSNKFTTWFGSFARKVLPEIMESRLPTCTSIKAPPVYNEKVSES